MYSCSECGSQFYDMSPYCPICGAKMKEFLFFEAVPGPSGVFRKVQGGEYSDE
jgi:predicted amidophosphoribosyltransferase